MPDQTNGKPIQVKEWSSDEIWNVVKERINSQLKIVFWILGGFFSALAFLAGLFLAVGGVRDALVKQWVVDVDAKIEAYLGNVVAYSYSSEFRISGSSTGQYYYNMPYYKTERDSGKLHCRAFYPSDKIKNKINITFNDKKEPTYYMGLTDPTRPKTIDQKFPIPQDDNQLFDSVRTADQYVTFQIDRKVPFDGAITLDCTILIIGPARIRVEDR
jgi:hypothetical protein